MVAFDDLVFNISKQGYNDRTLWRWSCISITGKNEATTTTFTCYCPTRSPVLGSGCAQHLFHTAKHKSTLPNIDCPQQRFGID